jgi:hypothetical protein
MSYNNHLSIAFFIVPLIVSHFDVNYGRYKSKPQKTKKLVDYRFTCGQVMAAFYHNPM